MLSVSGRFFELNCTGTGAAQPDREIATSGIKSRAPICPRPWAHGPDRGARDACKGGERTGKAA